jgi:carbamoyl-phosphate synthase large subunit
LPRDSSLESILVLGSGPIVIGQACEFDYSGTQAVKALAAEGFRVILMNSNPATIMTDPDLLAGSSQAHRTYIEPMTLAGLARILERERPDAILPTVGGQTAINLTLEAEEAELLERHQVRLLGADVRALRLAEDRLAFKRAMMEIGLDVPRSGLASSREEALAIADELGYPVVVRASFTLGGMGSGMAHDRDEFQRIVARGLELSPAHQVLVEESVLGWREFELEVMRDARDQAVVVCSIENVDPMGVHTGDSITVAPAMTLTDREYQQMRDQAFRVIRRVGVETGGSNIQFAVHPETRRMVVIEMNPRVSRSSALASKATGFAIAKIAARLAVGYTLDEIANEITRKTPASFEPALDYVVVKIPRWNFEKFPGSSPELGTQMKSVGEIMAIGRTFKEALLKGMRSLEMATTKGHGQLQREIESLDDGALAERVRHPLPERIYAIREALSRGGDRGFTVSQIAGATGIEPWFLHQIAEIVEIEAKVARHTLADLPVRLLSEAKRTGASDARLARLLRCPTDQVRSTRSMLGIRPVYHRIDTCAGEFESFTPYLYSTYETRCESEPTDRRKVVILGGGPIRIGQGIEFDYCACHAAFALKAAGIESVMINCNPETVSTDYDTADRLYFEPVTLEDVLHVVELEKPEGVIVQFGGQTPLNLARGLEKAGVKTLGTSVDSIDLAEDRRRFSDLLRWLEIPQPEMGTAANLEEAIREARRIGYPVIVRPSYVLGGRAMRVVYDDETLWDYATRALELTPDHPLFLDRFIEDAFEVDVDAVSDGRSVLIAGIQQHIEEAGIHSGDSACVLPPFKVGLALQQTMREYTTKIAHALQVVGLLNVQYAIKNGVVYVLEANPRASRTIPYVSKATGLPLVSLATRLILGETLASLVDPARLEPDRLEADRLALDRLGPDRLEPDRKAPASISGARASSSGTSGPAPRASGSRGRNARASAPGGHSAEGRVFVKMPVFSSNRFPEVDTLLGPEMRSTGEVLGIGRSFGEAFAKAAAGSGMRLPLSGRAFLSVNDNDKPEAVPIARDLAELGFELLATSGTAAFLREAGLRVGSTFKVNEGEPHVADRIAGGEIQLVINTPLGRESYYDESAIRKEALAHGIPCITTLSGSRAVVDAIRTLRSGEWTVESLQEIQETASRHDRAGTAGSRESGARTGGSAVTG